MSTILACNPGSNSVQFCELQKSLNKKVVVECLGFWRMMFGILHTITASSPSDIDSGRERDPLQLEVSLSPCVRFVRFCRPQPSEPKVVSLAEAGEINYPKGWTSAPKQRPEHPFGQHMILLFYYSILLRVHAVSRSPEHTGHVGSAVGNHHNNSRVCTSRARCFERGRAWNVPTSTACKAEPAASV